MSSVLAFTWVRVGCAASAPTGTCQGPGRTPGRHPLDPGRVKRVIGVLIVDDQALVRTVLAITLGRHPEIQVLGHCTDGTEVVEAARRLQPDVVLMDLHMPGTGGLQATRDLLRTQPAARVIIFSASPALDDISQAAEAGASG